MHKRIIDCIKMLSIGLLLMPTVVLANSAELDNAVKAYYAGRPARAVELIKPLAQTGDIAAQVLLGNILYSLSRAEHIKATDEAIDWYEKAAVQGSAEANNALGVIYYNQWIASRQEQDAVLAIVYYEKAIGLGARVVREPLIKLKKLSGVSADKAIMMAKELAEKKKLAQLPGSKAESPSIIPRPIVETDVPAVIEIPPEPAIETPEPAVEMPRIIEEDPAQPIEEPVLITETSESGEAAVLVRERPLLILRLAEIAQECGNYTRAGFDVYADAIKGAVATGNASVRKIDRGLLRLEMKQAGVKVKLNLKDVPESLLANLSAGDKFLVQGIILQSQLAESECTIHLQYSPQTS